MATKKVNIVDFAGRWDWLKRFCETAVDLVPIFTIAIALWRHYNPSPHGLCSFDAATLVYVSLKGIYSGECQ